MNKKLDGKNGKFIFCTQAKSGYENIPSPADSVYCSAQITLANHLLLPEQAPPCEKIMSYSVRLRIESTKSIDSVEIIDNNLNKGKKLIVSGITHIRLEYISCHDPSQKIHYHSWEQPFNAVIIQLCCNKEKLFPSHFNLSDYMVYAYTEFLKISCKNTHSFDATIALRIWLQELKSTTSPMNREFTENEGGLG